MNRKLLEDVMARTADSGVEPAELQQAVNKATAGCIMQTERPSNRLFGLGSRWLTCGEYISTDKTLEILRGLDQESVANAARRYLRDEPCEVIAAAGLVAADSSSSS